MSEFRIQTFVLGEVSTNCYLIYHQGTREAVVVDPADNGAYILNKCREIEVKPTAILLTHGHFDHILAVKDICRAFPCKVYAGREEDRLLQDSSLNLSGSMGSEQMCVEADVLVKDGDILSLVGFDWQVLETPGHTAGSVCYYVESEQVLISGDTLFANSLGRTDLPTGDMRAIIRSIKEKLLSLPERVMVYPGHGEVTTIEHEKRYNPVAAYRRR
ncbi:MAG: MBL fold metallo-hydrolase [Lachnospiraceae bacterium]|jgi:glyoxylase-like metal-dependent hydrolase (beta-lactamase superfamily II)|nr:MBL fold metallo-hydrolase [Lachnospiraceae bacterium]MCI9281941.1 MBL fold metallo-hydrolase [Lachnospiraceae bacterium]